MVNNTCTHVSWHTVNWIQTVTYTVHVQCTYTSAHALTYIYIYTCTYSTSTTVLQCPIRQSTIQCSWKCITNTTYMYMYMLHVHVYAKPLTQQWACSTLLLHKIRSTCALRVNYDYKPLTIYLYVHCTLYCTYCAFTMYIVYLRMYCTYCTLYMYQHITYNRCTCTLCIRGFPPKLLEMFALISRISSNKMITEHVPSQNNRYTQQRKIIPEQPVCGQ